MNKLTRILMTIFGGSFMGCQPHDAKGNAAVEIQSVSFQDEEEDVEMPDSLVGSKFTNMEEWLFHICEKEPSEVPVDNYRFEFFETDTECAVFLLGYKADKLDASHSVSRIVYEPSEKYFRILKKEFKNSPGQLFSEVVKKQLEQAFQSPTFKNSFLGKSKSVQTWAVPTDLRRL